ncbi:MAG TPA: maleylpyruvate isomerase N-terminal domain-containing protein [Trebonia sp.]|jgi:hypothetical protein
MPQIHEQLAIAALEAARLARAVDPSQLGDPTPCPDYDVRELTAHLLQEIVLHSWDLAVATGQTARFPDDVVAAVLDRLDVELEPERNDGWYAAPLAAADTSPLDRAVARSGRDPSWNRPTGA